MSALMLTDFQRAYLREQTEWASTAAELTEEERADLFVMDVWAKIDAMKSTPPLACRFPGEHATCAFPLCECSVPRAVGLGERT